MWRCIVDHSGLVTLEQRTVTNYSPEDPASHPEELNPQSHSYENIKQRILGIGTSRVLADTVQSELCATIATSTAQGI